jgi:gamma-glutamyltranspeptidase / glutathione hydrolase
MSDLRPSDWRRALGASLLVLTWLLAPGVHAQTGVPAPEAPTGRIAKQAATTTRDMVAAANPLAAQAGREILAAGGSAIDATVAVQLVLNLVEPSSSGIGGGAFLLYWDEANLVTLDGRETAPAAAKPERFLGPDGKPMQFYDAVVGGRSVGGARHLAAAGDSPQALGQAALVPAFPASDPPR